MPACALLALVSLTAAAAAAAAAPLATFTDFHYHGRQALTASPTPGPGEYANPILAGSRSDPSIVRVGRTYYLANASMGYWPGQPIWRSGDMVHWELAASAISRTEQLDLSRIDPGWQGLWAPDLKHHDGWFYLINTCYGCGGIFAMRSRTVEGPWPKPTFLKLTGIDPSIFFDEDGRAYIVFNGPPPEGAPAWEGHRAIWLQEIDPSTLALRGERTLLVDGGTHPPEHPFWIEGPHIFRKDGRYYLIAAQGGTNEHHSEVVFRSDALKGPYVAGPAPILSQEGLDPGRKDPVANAGHADFVQTPAGDWWAVFLGARPYGDGATDFATGRDTFLLPVSWKDGWPTILPAGEAIAPLAPRPRLPDAPAKGWPLAGDYTITDRFTSPDLSPRWSRMRSSDERWWRTGGGGLAITPQPVELGASRGQPSFVALRQAHANVEASLSVRLARADPGDRAGLAVVQDARRWFLLAVTAAPGGARTLRLFRRTGDAEPAGGVPVESATLPAGGAPVRLRVRVEGPAFRFAYRPGSGGWRDLGGVQDGAFLSNRIAKGFTGVVLGPAAIAGAPASPEAARSAP